MSKRVRRNMGFLKKLMRQPKSASRRRMLKSSTDDELLSLCEIALNVAKGKVPVTDGEYSKLRKNRAALRNIADKRMSIDRKRSIVNQKGGAIISLLAAALPFITSLFTSKR